MVSGRIQAETTAAELVASPELQQRYLGVEAASTHEEMS
jgi:ABC-type branched-subunit amino acid transport system ATPase component